MVLFSSLREYFFFWMSFFKLILWPSSMCFYCFRPVAGLISLFILSILGFPWGLPFCRQYARDICAPDGWHQDVCPGDKRLRRTYPRRMAQTVTQTDGPGSKSLDGRVLQFHGFSSEGHPSVPFVLALQSQRWMAPRRMSLRRRKAARGGGSRDGGRPRRMSPRWMSPRQKVRFLKWQYQVLVNATNSFFSFR